MLISKKLYENICLTLVLVFSILINNYYGRIGVHPTDSFSHLDTSYNILKGEHPIKDIWIMSGIFIDYTQAFFFRIFGPNFNSLIYHASLFNALISISLFFVLSKSGINLILSTIISCCVAILCYPVAGTPFPYQHSFILSLISLLIFFQCINHGSSKYWFALPIFMFLSFMCMQLPSGLINAILIPLILSYLFIFKDTKSLLYFILGGAACLLILLSYFLILKIPVKDFVLQYILFPLSVGDGRVLGSNEAFSGAKLMNKFTFRGVIGHFKFIHLILIGMIIFLVKNFKHFKKEEKFKIVLINVALILSVISFIFHQLITANQTFIFSLIPVMGGLLYLMMENKYKANILPKVFLIILIIFSTFKYHFEYNEKRKFMDLQSSNLKLAVNGASLHQKFNGLNWISPHYNNDPSKEIELLKKALNIIDNEKENIMLITHYQFFSLITEKKIYIPNRWYYLENNTFPSNNRNPYFEDYTNFFNNKILKNDIEKIYILESTENEISINNFRKHLVNKCFESIQINNVFSSHKIKECN